MADDNSELRKAARLVLPYLDELLDEGAARELRDALGSADDRAIEALAVAEPALADWLADYLDASAGVRAYNPLGGNGEPVAPSATFRCPQGTLVWYRRFVSEPVPRCPTHDVDLARIDEDTSAL